MQIKLMGKMFRKIFSLRFWGNILAVIFRPIVFVIQKMAIRNRKKFFLTAGIFIMVITIVFGWKNLYVLAQQFIDSFTDTSRVADTWNVDVDTGAGEVKLATRTCDDGVWFCNESTICSNQLGDGSYIIVKRTDESGLKTWGPYNSDCDKPQCNGATLVADNTVNFSSYPARDACKTIGGRLPTTAELGCIYTNQATFGNNFSMSFYWAATEFSSTYAVNVDFSSGYSGTSYKYYGRSVRCVKGW